MHFQAVLFDLDGTLLDTLADIANTMNDALRQHGFPPHPLDSYRQFVGEGAGILARRALPAEAQQRDPELAAKFIAIWRKAYGRRWAENSCPYPGIPDLLDALTTRGLRLAVLSNKPDVFTQAMVAQLLPKWRFEVVFGERTGVPKKPDPAGAQEIARLMRLSARDFVYLGDTGIDMQTACAAGMFPAGVLWGFRGKEELLGAGAKVLLKEPLDLLPYFG